MRGNPASSSYASDPRLAGHRHVPVVLRTQSKHPVVVAPVKPPKMRGACAGSQRLVDVSPRAGRGVAKFQRRRSRPIDRREEAIEVLISLVVIRRERTIRIVGRENHQRRCVPAVSSSSHPARRHRQPAAFPITSRASDRDVRRCVRGMGRGNVHVGLQQVASRSLVALLVGDRVDHCRAEDLAVSMRR